MGYDENRKILSSVEYIAVDASPELAKADLNIISSGTEIKDLLTEKTRCCGGGCKKS